MSDYVDAYRTIGPRGFSPSLSEDIEAKKKQSVRLLLHSNVLLMPDGDYDALLEAIRTFTSLKHVVLGGGTAVLDYKLFPAIANNENIQEVTVKDDEFSGVVATDSLATLFGSAHIKKLTIGDYEVRARNGINMKDLNAALCENHCLETIKLVAFKHRYPPEDRISVVCHEGLASLPNLKELAVELLPDRNHVLPNHVGRIVASSTTLETLSLKHCQLDVETWDVTSRMQSLTKIRLDDCNFADTASLCKFIQFVKTSPTVNSIALMQVGFLDGNVAVQETYVADLLRDAKNIRHFAFVRPRGGLIFAGFDNSPLVVALEHGKHLKSLDCLDLGKESFQKLTSILPEMKDLQELNVTFQYRYRPGDRVREVESFLCALEKNHSVTSVTSVNRYNNLVGSKDFVPSHWARIHRCCRLNKLSKLFNSDEIRSADPRFLPLRPQLYAIAMESTPAAQPQQPPWPSFVTDKRLIRPTVVYQDLLNNVDNLTMRWDSIGRFPEIQSQHET